MVPQPPQTPRTAGKKAPASTANKPKPPSTRSTLRAETGADAAGSTTPPTPRRRRAPAKAASSTRTSGPADAGSRTHYIAEAAYYLAERRGFCEGSGLEDWWRSEAEIDRRLASGAL
ncbi:MAG TPA: DUF2934 domain-containing protein [Rhodocyclaceae bacterium]|nr:DUF2934 domain-containing protein [Rhodocyclaceae bacterium]